MAKSLQHSYENPMDGIKRQKDVTLAESPRWKVYSMLGEEQRAAQELQ